MCFQRPKIDLKKHFNVGSVRETKINNYFGEN